MEHFGGITLHDLTTPLFWFGVMSIIMIDLLLSGDNALLIALACRNLPHNLRKKGILLGMAGAVSLRVLLATVAVALLNIPYLKAFGSLLLLWIAVKLLIGEEEGEHEVDGPQKLWAAVKTIIIADFVMSLDNIIAIAGASQGKPALLWFGLLVSIPLVVFGSQILVSLMDRFPWIIALGAGILGWTAGHMFVTDIKITEHFGTILHSPYLLNGQLVAIGCAIAVIVVGNYLKKRRDNGKEIVSEKSAA
jgi:YjbE family integral membrane protein